MHKMLSVAFALFCCRNKSVRKYALSLGSQRTATHDIDESLLQRLCGMCVQDVKAVNGKISFEDAVRYQNGED